MTSISNSGPAKVESWMVSKLFGSSSPDQSGNQTPNSNAIAQSSSSIASIVAGTGSISSATALALSSLRPGGSDPTSAITLQSPFDRFYVDGDQNKSITQSNAIAKANGAMTSAQVNAAMYGNGIATAGYDVQSPNTTFADLIAVEQSGVDYQFQQAADTSLSGADREYARAKATRDQAYVNTIQTAYDNRTLVFQNAADVQGLDFTETVTFGGDDPKKAATSVTGTQTYNQDFFDNRPDKNNSSMMDTGNGMMLYLTW